jgi:hypothetical protein
MIGIYNQNLNPNDHIYDDSAFYLETQVLYQIPIVVNGKSELSTEI